MGVLLFSYRVIVSEQNDLLSSTMVLTSSRLPAEADRYAKQLPHNLSRNTCCHRVRRSLLGPQPRRQRGLPGIIYLAITTLALLATLPQSSLRK